MFTIESWEKSKERLAALWEKEILDRCCISVEAPKTGSTYVEPEISDTQDGLAAYYMDPEDILQRQLSKLENTYYGGDAFPCIWPYLGTGGHIAYLKNVKMELAKDTIWFQDTLKDWEEDRVEYDDKSPLYQKQTEMMKYLVAQSKGRYFVGMPDNCGSADGLFPTERDGQSDD